MTSTSDIQELTNQVYKYGFETDIEAGSACRRGSVRT